MSSPDASPLCVYLYDALDRLAVCKPVNQTSIRRFYQLNRLATAVQGNTRHSVIQADDLLLAAQRVGPDQTLTGLLATDQANSVLHSVEAMWSQTFAYSPYGVRSPQTAAVGIPGFTGQTIDPVTGHYLPGNGVRAFNPTLMRFNSPDALSPFGEGGLNAYAYCEGDPVNYSDPSGQNIRAVIIPISLLGSAMRKTFGLSRDAGEGFFEVAYKGLVPGDVSLALKGPRAQLDKALEPLGDSSSLFARALRQVNNTFGSNNDQNLTLKQAFYYAKLAKQAASGEISDPTAFIRAAISWARNLPRQGPVALVGMVLNSGGSLFSGPAQIAKYKTGAALMKPVQQAKAIRSTTRTP